MLTTMTTVLGLAPLLTEKSQQAQFLKPTVITLVYGLGFGMVLVLLVVPALVAMQSDVARPMAALRHAVKARATRWLILGVGAVQAAWLALTMGWTVTTGDLSPTLVEILPGLASLAPMRAALLAFLGGAAVIVVVGYVLAALGLGLRSRSRA